MKALMRVSVTAIAVLVISCTTQGTSATDETSQADKAATTAGAATAQGKAVATAGAATPEAGDTESAEHTCGGEGSCCGGAGHTPADKAPVPPDAVWITLKVSGMRCGNCANKIRTTLADMDEVLGVEADHETGEVKIAAAPGADGVRGKVAPRIDALGYTVLEL